MRAARPSAANEPVDVGRAPRARRRARRARAAGARARPRRRRGPARARARGAATPRRPPRRARRPRRAAARRGTCATCARRLGADELADELAVLERLDRRDALDPEGGGDAAGWRRCRAWRARPCRSRLRTAFSSTGVSCRHGPHHSAQKSTTTGTSCERSMTSCSKVASVTSTDHDSEGRTPGRGRVQRRIGRASTLAGEEAGEGTPVVLLHGLTATRRYVVMGSRALERSGHRVVAYDARGHGASTGAEDPDAYDYDDLVDDLRAVLDDRGIDRAVLAGASMGAHTVVRFALDHPERVAGLVIVTPAFDPEEDRDDGLERWDALAEGLRERRRRGLRRGLRRPAGARAVEGDDRQGAAPAPRRPRAPRRGRRRAPRGAALAPVRVVGRARPRSTVADRGRGQPRRGRPRHPYAIGERYAEAIPGAELRSEEPGSSPLAWQGGQLSKVISELAERAGAAGP